MGVVDTDQEDLVSVLVYEVRVYMQLEICASIVRSLAARNMEVTRMLGQI